MWFKNIKAYQITQPLSLDDDDLERVLSEQAFRPCKSQDLATMGFASPFSQAGKQGTMFQRVGQRYWLTVKKQEKLLPAAVINAELDDMVAKIEMETGSPVGKKAKADLKQEIQTRLLPQAFTKNTYTHGFISLEDNLVAVDASADGKAEAFLALVRKAIGSLPVVPLARHSLQSELTHWLTDAAPDGIALLEEAEFKSTDDAGSIIRCKNQDLTADEVLSHINTGMVVNKIAVIWKEGVQLIIDDHFAFKRLKFEEIIQEKAQSSNADSMAEEFDQEFAIMTVELSQMIKDLVKAFGGIETLDTSD